MRIATTNGAALSIAIAALAGFGIWSLERPRGPQPTGTPEANLPEADPRLELSSSTVEREPPPPPEGPFYASLFVAGRTWDLPCTFGSRFRDEPGGTQRCHVDSVETTPTQTSARIACWFVHGPDRDPDPAINTYVMTARGLFINGTSGAPLFTPKPIAKPLPRRWGMDEPSGEEPDRATAIVRHNGAWCRLDETQGMDISFGTAECISKRGLVGSTYRRDGFAQRCGDVP